MNQAQKNNCFWQEMNQLATTNPIIIDKPKGTTHPRYPEVIYPFDHSYLESTQPVMEVELMYGSAHSK